MSDKQQVFFLPGLLCDGTVWRHQSKHLDDIIIPRMVDYRHCKSISAMAECVLAEAPESFAVAGHSMGGRVAFEILRIAGHRVSRLALLDTAFGPRAEGEVEKRMALVKLARKQGMAALARAWLLPMVYVDSLNNTELMAELYAMIEQHSVEQFAGQIQALIDRPDATQLLAQIQCPTLVLCGRQDSWRTPAQHAQLANMLPNAVLEIIEDCGHMSTVERPELVTASLRAWLGRPV